MQAGILTNLLIITSKTNFHMQTLIIEPAYLKQHLDDPKLLIIDLRAEESYERGHIPGAVHLHPSKLVSGIKPAVGKLPDMESLENLFSSIGYSDDQYLVSYDDEGGGWAGRFLWTLHAIGHQHCAMLNGGIVAWQHDGFTLSDALNDPTATKPVISLDRSVIASKEDILSKLDSGEVIIWDARSADEFHGRKVFALRGGHIPGAINLDWLNTMDPARGLRVRADIEQLLTDQAILQGKPIITHCQTHHRSGLTYVIGKSLGLDIRAYDGSWSEWGNTPDLPVEISN